MLRTFEPPTNRHGYLSMYLSVRFHVFLPNDEVNTISRIFAICVNRQIQFNGRNASTKQLARTVEFVLFIENESYLGWFTRVACLPLATVEHIVSDSQPTDRKKREIINGSQRKTHSHNKRRFVGNNVIKSIEDEEIVWTKRLAFSCQENANEMCLVSLNLDKCSVLFWPNEYHIVFDSRQNVYTFCTIGLTVDGQNRVNDDKKRAHENNEKSTQVRV